MAAIAPELEAPAIDDRRERRPLPRQDNHYQAFVKPDLSLQKAIADAFVDRRLIVLLPVLLIAGMAANLILRLDPSPVPLAIVMAVLLGGLIASLRTDGRRRVLLAASALWAGFCLLPLHGLLSGTAMLAYPAYGTYSARVDEVLTDAEDGLRIIISSISPTQGDRAVPIRRARIVVPTGIDIAPGDEITGRIRFYAVPGPALPGGFDSQFHGYFDGIGAYGSVIGPLEVTPHAHAAPVEELIDNVRRGIARRVDAVLPQPAAGIVRAIINGDQSAVTAEARDTMATAGLAHVLSISGLHLTLTAGGVFIALRIVLALLLGPSNRLPIKQIAACGGIIAALLYYSISGGNVAALRSTIMIVLVLGAVLAGRQALTMRNVAMAALVVILLDPASVFRPSFQLSFAAVVALVGAWEFSRKPRDEAPSVWRKAVLYMGGIAATSLVAGGATLLFSVYHFQQTSPLGVIGNMVAMPLVGFVMMPAAVFAVLAMPIGFEAPFLQVMAWSVDRMLDVATFVSGVSTGIDASPLLTPTSLGIGTVALAWFAFLKGRWRLLGPALAVPAVLLFALDGPPDVLVSDTTRALAVRSPDGLALADGKASSFVVEVWQETYGTFVTSGRDLVRCDSVACLVSSSAGFEASVVTDVAGFAEDCPRVALVIARRAAPGWCRELTTVIDGDTLQRGGVQWLAWQGDHFEIRPAISDLTRPWRVQR